MHVPITTPTEDVTWNQTRLNKRRMAKAILARLPPDSALLIPGFIQTRGDKGWLLIGPVHHNGDFYRRHDEERGTVYGSLTDFLEAGMPEAMILSPGEVSKAAAERHEFVTLERESDGWQVEVAMLHDWMTKDLPRSCGVYVGRDGRLSALNPELPARYNMPCSRYRKLSAAKRIPDSFANRLMKAAEALT